MNATGPVMAPPSRRAFTLIELMVSIVVLSLMLVMLERLTSSTQKTLTSTTGKIEQFRDARQAFEAITRRLSQATLNTYWDYARDSTTGAPTAYIRQSELRFVSGRTDALLDGTAAANRPTHAIFFQAPLGLVADAASYHGLDNLLNTWGYCIEYGDDKLTRPGFLALLDPPPAPKNRFRLMEMHEPSESFSLYLKEAQKNQGAPPVGGNDAYIEKTWFSDPNSDPDPEKKYLPLGLAGAKERPAVHVLAENIVALVILPKLTKADQTAPGNSAQYTDGSLSPHYLYDSKSTSNDSDTSPYFPPTGTGDPALNPKNQLPPIVQVTMVAVDEASFGRLLAGGNSGPATALMTTMDGLFKTVGDTVNPANEGYAKDLQTLQTALQSYRLNYRVFTTAVSLKAAKWSRDKTN